jgi:hypothetical protein
MIDADGPSKRRGGRTVVSGVTLRCEPGTVAREARATRVRELATLSWLSTRRVGARRALGT